MVVTSNSLFMNNSDQSSLQHIVIIVGTPAVALDHSISASAIILHICHKHRHQQGSLAPI
jgi:hypothetical protein